MLIEVDEWYMTVCPIQDQRHRDPKVVKMADFKVHFLCQNACNQILTVDYDTPRQYLNVNQIFILAQRHVTFKLWVFHLLQMNSAFYKESTSSPVRSLFIFFLFLIRCEYQELYRVDTVSYPYSASGTLAIVCYTSLCITYWLAWFSSVACTELHSSTLGCCCY